MKADSPTFLLNLPAATTAGCPSCCALGLETWGNPAPVFGHGLPDISESPPRGSEDLPLFRTMGLLHTCLCLPGRNKTKTAPPRGDRAGRWISNPRSPRRRGECQNSRRGGWAELGGAWLSRRQGLGRGSCSFTASHSAQVGSD